jgi:two-component system response regulator MtrA
MDELVLLVEDDASIRELTTSGLERAGFRVDAAADGPEALEQFARTPPDVVVLDLMLPGLDGYEVCRRIRATSQVPVVMLSARADTVDVVVGLEVGADDYVTKPFEIAELVARIRAVLRRSAPTQAEGVIRVRDVEIDPAAFRVRKGEAEVALTATEFRLLLELARRTNQVFTREVLLQQVWSYDYLGDSRLVDVAVQRLRGKIEDDPRSPQLIRTVRGVGYRLDPG